MPAMDHYTEPRVSAKKSAKKSTRTPFQRFIFLAFTAVAFFYGYTMYSVWTWNGPSLAPVQKAVVILSGPSNVTGTVTFYQANGRGPVVVQGDIRNMDSNALCGFHVHQSGDLTDGCLSAGSHFNPLKKTHGAPTDKNRHVGDLGNIQSDASGSAIFYFTDPKLSLNGPLSIVGRAVVVHAGTDDLGKGGDEESLKTGNAGARAACGVVGVVV